MEQYETRVVLFVLILLHKAFAVPPNFPHAREIIKDTKLPINYDTFCVEKGEGGDKIACRIKKEPTVGFLVCKTSILEGEPCKEVIATEIKNLATLTAAKVKTVIFSEPQINGVNCVNPGDKNLCSGFLEEWVGKDRGYFKHIRDRISDHTVQALVQEVKSFTSNAGLVTTVAHLMAIKNYMVGPAPSYRQICDLQGFFLIGGGFLVNDVPAISENMNIAESCWDGEPTTKEVIKALDDMIEAFQKP